MNNCEIFKSIKFFGKIIVQYNICKTGNKNVTENINIKAKKAKKAFKLDNFIFFFFLIPPLAGE